MGIIVAEEHGGSSQRVLGTTAPIAQGPPTEVALASALPEGPLDAAIRKAQQWLLQVQHPEGYWLGELEGDTILESEYALLLHFLGRSNDPRLPALCRTLLDKQLPDGLWSIYPGGPGEVSASVKAYFVLKLAGHSPDAPHMVRAREGILALGGVAAANSFTKIYLAVFGQYPWEYVPSVPPEIVLLPLWFPFHVYEMSSWSRTIVVPLAILHACRPFRPVPEAAAIPELFAGPMDAEHLALKWTDPVLSWRNFFVAVDRLLKWYERRPSRSLRSRALKAAETWIRERVPKSAGLGAIFPPMINTAMALTCLGYPETDPAIASQLSELEALEIAEGGRLRVQPCVSPVWDTAIAAIALHESGLPSDHPSLVRAGEWLLSKEVRERGDWAVKRPNLSPGGWYFEFANEFYPDIDDTAMVLMALHRIALPQTSGKEAAMARGLRWLLGMQGRDGGWASFDVDNCKAALTQIPFADHNAMIDPSTSDITARLLEMLGCLGYDASHPAAVRALLFLAREQEPDGAWYGRWGVNYLYGTWQALRGLRLIGYDMEAEPCRRAVQWLLSVQNADGGWGESCRSYDDPAQRGIGPSTPSQTAWALMGLLSAGEENNDAVRRGVAFLLSRQRADGSWDEEQFTGTGFPRVFYLRYHLYRHSFPLMALGMYRRLVTGDTGRGGTTAPPPRASNGRRVSAP